MTVGRMKDFPYPEKVDSIEGIGKHLISLYRALTEDQEERITDLENMVIDSQEVGNLTIVTSFKPTIDNVVDIGATTLRFKDLYLAGNLKDDTVSISVAQAKDAYDKRVDTWGDGLEYSSQTAAVDYNTTNLKITLTELNTIQDIATTSSPTFVNPIISKLISSIDSDVYVDFTEAVDSITFHPGVDDADNYVIFKSTDDTAVSPQIYPSTDGEGQLGLTGSRWNALFVSGNLSDGTNALTIANAKTAYDNRVDTWGDGLQISSFTASVDYNTTNLKITSTELDTIQGISSVASPTFVGLDLTGYLDFTEINDPGASSAGDVRLFANEENFIVLNEDDDWRDLSAGAFGVSSHIAEAITVSDATGLDITWSAGAIHDNLITGGSQRVAIAAQPSAQTLTATSMNYLFFDKSGGVVDITTDLDAIDFMDGDFPVCSVGTDDDDITYLDHFKIGNLETQNIKHTLWHVFQAVVTSGLIASEHSGGAAFDIDVSAGHYVHDGYDVHDVSATIDSTSTNIVRWFHNSSNVWTTDVNAQIDAGNWDNISDSQVVITNNNARYYRSTFYVVGDVIHWVYPSEEFVTLNQALEGNDPTPPAVLEHFPKSTTLVMKGNAAALPAAGSDQWIDVRPTLGAIGTAGTISDHGNLSGLSGDDHSHYLLINGTRDMTGNLTIADGGSINLQEDITFAGATGVNLIKMPDNLLDALSIQEGLNKYITFDTVNDEEDIIIYKSVDILHTATHADDHALEIDTDAANYGDVKAVDLDYITGSLATGQDDAIILVNIDETAATGGDVFGLEVLATEGSAGIYGIKVGVVIGPVHQDSGVFINPTTGTDNTPSTDVAVMIDGNPATTTSIFESNSEYILIGGVAVFEEIEFIITTGASGAGIKPTFWYSTAGSHTFTQFTPVDGTDGFKHTGVVAWDASDLTNHAVNTDTSTYDIKVIRTRANLTISPILGFAKTAATTEYVWDKDGDVNIRNLLISDAGNIGSVGDPDAIAIATGGEVTLSQTLILSDVIDAATDTDKFLVLDGSNNVDFRTGANVLSDIGGAASSHAMSTHSDEDTYTLATTGSITSSGTGGVISGDASNAGSLIVYDGSDHKQTISTGALAGDITFILPTTDGDNLQFLQTNGAGTLTWAAGGGDVTAGANLTDLTVIRGDGGAKGVKTSTMLISDAGEMTNPSQPTFLAFNSAKELNKTGDGTDYTLRFDNEAFDVGANFATPTFTAPIDGKYQFNIGILLEDMDSDTFERLRIKIATSNRNYFARYVSGLIYTSNGELSIGISILVDMDANDTATVLIQVEGGTKTVDIGGHATSLYTQWSAVLIC